MLVMTAEPCPCGRPFPLIARIEGRSEDIVRLRGPDGRAIPVPPFVFTLVVERFDDIVEHQMIYGDGRLRLTLVPRAGVSPQELAASLAEALRAQIVSLGACPPPVEIAFAERLERSEDRIGKLKLIRSEPGAMPAGELKSI